MKSYRRAILERLIEEGRDPYKTVGERVFGVYFNRRNRTYVKACFVLWLYSGRSEKPTQCHTHEMLERTFIAIQDYLEELA